MTRNYSNVAVETALTAEITNSSSTIPVGSVSGYPAAPFTIILDPGLATEELVEVGGISGNSFTGCTRGVDGTPAQSHTVGAVVVHGTSARDFREPNEHVGATTDVHGIANTANLVTLAGSQTLTNKTLTNPTINGGTITGLDLNHPDIAGGGTWTGGPSLTNATLITPTIASFVNAQHDHSDAAHGGTLAGGGGGLGNLPRVGFGSKTANSGAITWTTPAFNNGPMWSSGNPTRLTATSGGIYIAGASAYASDAAAKDTFTLSVRKNGTNVASQVGRYNADSFSFDVGGLSVVACVPLATNDYLEIHFVSLNGASVTPFTIQNAFAVCLVAS